MEDPPELRVDSVQEGVGSAGPALIHGRHGGQVLLQVEEVLLNLDTNVKKFSSVSLLHNLENLKLFLTILWTVKL